MRQACDVWGIQVIATNSLLDALLYLHVPYLPWAVPGCATMLYSIAFSVLPPSSTQTRTPPTSSGTMPLDNDDDDLNDRVTSSLSTMMTVARLMWMLTPVWLTSIVTVNDSWSSSSWSSRRVRLWHSFCSLMVGRGWKRKDWEKLS